MMFLHFHVVHCTYPKGDDHIQHPIYHTSVKKRKWKIEEKEKKEMQLSQHINFVTSLLNCSHIEHSLKSESATHE